MNDRTALKQLEANNDRL